MSSSISDALSTLSDRGLRRLLGARTFLRGLDYEKRRVVDGVNVVETSANGTVKGSDPEPYQVNIKLGGEGITSHCTCPAFQKTGQHCKHVAALLINVRNKARAASPRPPQPQHNAQHNGGTPNPNPNPNPIVAQQNMHGAGAGSESKASRRRDRRRRGHSQQIIAPPGLSAPTPDASARPTGIGAWLAPEGSTRRLNLEFRVHVRQGGLTVTVLDADARVPLLPSVALAWQAVTPTGDRNALRTLARSESGNPRHPAVDIRGEDVADLLPTLQGRKVLLEPALMHLRFLEEPLRPRFDLEMVGADTIVAKCTFGRDDNGRRFALTSGGWFDGAPGWHIDTSEGIARPLDKRVSPAALRRLLRSPTIAEPAFELINMITNTLPKVASEVGAPLPDLTQVADVVDMSPSFKVNAGGSLVEARVALKAIYGEREIDVRADGISPPIIIEPPKEGHRRASCVRTDIVAQQHAVELLLEAGLKPDESGEFFVAEGDTAIRFWSQGVGKLPKTWDLYLPDDLTGARMRGKPVQMHARVSSGVDWLSLQVSYESDGIGVDRASLEQCLREGKKFVRLADNSYAPIDATRVQAMLDREIEIIASQGKTGKLSMAHSGRVQELLDHADSATVSAGAKALFKKLGSLTEIKAAKKPRALKATLRPYQEQGLSWLNFIHEIGSGGVLADDMGLGKTIQTIALLLTLKQENPEACALIVAPTSVVTNWQREIERFAPSLKATLWHGAARKGQQDELAEANVIITSYALLRRDIEMLTKLKLDYAILDEAQNIKNPHSATAQAARELQANRRLALTGTPIENRLSEIWSIFEFVSPG
ncbi:MAG TPA: SNF2-related protein, partial [Polyangiaceae bacterium]|nr:SNF2-related protein [Polyangiaceae bacterium]